MSSVGGRRGGSGRVTPESSSVGGKPSLPGGLAEALRQRQASMQGKKDDDDDCNVKPGVRRHHLSLHHRSGKSSLKIPAAWNKTLSNEPGNDGQGDKAEQEAFNLSIPKA
ncbi:MAG: hypothetical protein Q9204_002585 [Flavoplaca sp. TL-2023a]